MNIFRLPPTPAHATDSEISGLFRLLEQERVTPASSSPQSSPADRELGAAFGRYARAVAAELNR